MGTKKNLDWEEEPEKKKKEDSSSPSQDKTNRFAVNDLIRKNGYSIHDRKKGKEPVWIKRGVLFKQSDILIRLDQQDLWNAEYLESLYWSGLEI